MRRAHAGATWTVALETNRALQFATAALVVYSVLSPADRVYGVATSGGPALGTVAAVAAYLCILPAQVWLVVSAARRPFGRRQRWALLAVAVVIFGVIPLAGVQWIGMLGMLAGLVLGGLRAPWSLAVYAALAAAPAPLAIALGQPVWDLYFGLSLPFVSLPLATGVWLIRTARQVQASRLELADQAVVRERRRVDEQLRVGVGAGLEEIVVRASSVATLLGDDSAAAQELDTLVDVARHTLSDARRTVARFREVSVLTELETAVTLLDAAGIDARLELPTRELAGTLDEKGRQDLRRAVSDLLSGPTGAVATIIHVTRDGDGVSIGLRAATDATTAEVAAS